MQKHLFFVFHFFIVYSVHSQVNYPRDYFASPVHIPITLAGNFGEIRPNHFHAGFDIRTNNREGLPVYAIADGYVSRIKISPVGYGKALYITHPNGFVSVYGHLRGFNTAIQTKTTTFQNLLQSFELDTLLNRDLLPVKKGDLIGFSGNTGSSQAPHLHFEIRDELTEKPINPYFFGYTVKDQVKPTIVSIAVFAAEDQARVNGWHITKIIIPKKVNDTSTISKTDSIQVYGSIGFGINCYDRENEGSGTNNVFSIELQSGGKRIYYCEMGTFSFDNARYVNAYIDYSYKQLHHQLIQKCFLSKNNLLEIYKDVQNRGIIDFNDRIDHWITFIVKDYAGNTASLVLKVKSGILDKEIHDNSFNKLDCLKENHFIQKGIHATIPAGALYDDLNFIRFHTGTKKGVCSPVYQLADETIALQKNMTLAIYAGNIPEKWREKACVVSIQGAFVKTAGSFERVDGKFNYEGGVFINDSVVANTNHFGKFAIAMDTVAPKISPLLKLSKTDSIADFRSLNVLKFKATDNLSGIKKYRATIDGKWVLCEYDEKNDLLFYTFDDMIQPGLHQFKLEVTDDKQNRSVWKVMFKK